MEPILSKVVVIEELVADTWNEDAAFRVPVKHVSVVVCVEIFDWCYRSYRPSKGEFRNSVLVHL